jgi:lysyl-tRNA synthetase, class II
MWRQRRLDTCAALAAGALAVGLADIGASLVPRMSAELAELGGALPVADPSVARSLTFAAGAVLLWLAAGLWRRKRRAWLLAVTMVALGVTAGGVRDPDPGQLGLSIALLIALVRSRGAFTVAGDPTSMRSVARALLVTLFAWMVVGSTLSTHLNRVTDLGFELLLVGGVVWGLQVWMRSDREPSPADRGDHARAQAIVERHGNDSLSFFALRRDRRYAFSAQGNAFLAYRVIAGCALVSGDPVGQAAEIPGLLDAFRSFAHARGWRLVYLHAGERWAAVHRASGMRAIQVGDEAVIRPGAFTLEGRSMRKVRQSVARLERAGYRIEMRPAGEIAPALRSEIEAVSDEWLGGGRERGFSMAMDDVYAHPQTLFVLGLDERGRLGGYLHLVPSLEGFSLSAMRRRPDTPNGLMEWMISRTVDLVGEVGAQELSLNFAVFAALLRTPPEGRRAARAARWAVIQFDRGFQLNRLYSFNSKFAPDWRTRYVCFERVIDVPVLSVATLHVESLLPLPQLRSSRA